ncbi:MAG: hypothetical protein LBE35_10355 [Clostridiales bacterium]|jgi:hypothetical protein|nr:hypothetical protein [Clostridiales bacterium]
MNILPRADEAVIPIEKFTKYALDPKNNADKYKAFELALGYTLENVEDLIESIRMGIKKFPATSREDRGFGTTYSVLMLLTGPNGKVAHVMTGWLDDAQTGEMRLTSAYVIKRRRGFNAET